MSAAEERGVIRVKIESKGPVPGPVPFYSRLASRWVESKILKGKVKEMINNIGTVRAEFI